MRSSSCLAERSSQTHPIGQPDLNPAWQNSYFNHIVLRSLPSGSNQSAIAAVWTDVISKTTATREQAPNRGAYVNEACRLDLNWQYNFYGSHCERLSEVKQKRDPTGVVLPSNMYR